MEALARAHHHLPLAGVETHHVERGGAGDAEPPALADGVVDDAAVASQHASVHMDDVAGLGGAGP